MFKWPRTYVRWHLDICSLALEHMFIFQVCFLHFFYWCLVKTSEISLPPLRLKARPPAKGTAEYLSLHDGRSN